MQPASNCLRSGRQLQQGHTPLAHRAVQQHSSRCPTCVKHARPFLPPLLHTAKQQQPCSAPHRGSSIRAAAVPAVVPVSVAAASFPALQHALAPVLPYIMAAAAACCAALVALMVVTPDSDLTRHSVRSNLPLALLGVAYSAVLLASWSSDTLHLMMPGSLEEGLKGGFNPQFFPTLESVQALFGRPFTAASFLLHVLAINLIAARSAFIDGARCRVPTIHSVLLSAVVGPLGLLSHQLTKWVFDVLVAVTGRDLRPAAKPKLEKSGPGTITIMPYDK